MSRQRLLHDAIGQLEGQEEALALLDTILSKILEFPADPRFRRLSYGASERLKSTLSAPALRLLMLLGFRQDPVLNDFYLTSQHASTLTTVPHLAPPSPSVLEDIGLCVGRIRSAMRQCRERPSAAEHQSLPPEPTLGEESGRESEFASSPLRLRVVGAAGTTVVTIQLPAGSPAVRRFHSSDLLQDVHRYAQLEYENRHRADAHPGPFQLRNEGQYPRRVFTADESQRTLQSLDLWPSCRLKMIFEAEAAPPTASADRKAVHNGKPKPSELLTRHLHRFDPPRDRRARAAVSVKS
jgi:hypothetical protein